MEYYSAIKKNEILTFATWMKLDGIILSAISQTERQIMYDITYMQNLNIGKNELVYKTKLHIEKKIMVTGEKRGDKLED